MQGTYDRRLKAIENSIKPKNGKAVFTSKADCINRINAYFDTHLAESGEVADIESLADYLGTTRDIILKMMDDKRYGKIMRMARNRIAKIKKQLAFRGKIPATVLSFDLKNNHGYRDKPDEGESNSEQVVFKGKIEDWAK